MYTASGFQQKQQLGITFWESPPAMQKQMDNQMEAGTTHGFVGFPSPIPSNEGVDSGIPVSS